MNFDLRKYGKEYTKLGELYIEETSIGPVCGISIGKKKGFNEDCIRLGKKNDFLGMGLLSSSS